MAPFTFNIMDAAGYGYYRVWTERAYLLKLALIPLMIKFACTIALLVLGFQDNILRQGLVLLPGVLAEGWVLAQFLRTLLKDERWPTYLPPEIDDKVLDRLLLRARGIVAAVLAYGLIALASYAVRYLVFGVVLVDVGGADGGVGHLATDANPDSQNITITPLVMLPMLGLSVALFWGFRLMWVYIPFSVLMPLRAYLQAVNGWMSSVRMMVLFFCCMTPLMFLVMIISRILSGFIQGFGGGDDVARFIMVFVAVVAETLIGLVATAAFVWAMRSFLPKNPELLKELPKLKGEE